MVRARPLIQIKKSHFPQLNDLFQNAPNKSLRHIKSFNIPSTRPLRSDEKGGADKGTKDSEDRLTATVGSASAEPAQLQSNLQTIYLRSL